MVRTNGCVHDHYLSVCLYSDNRISTERRTYPRPPMRMAWDEGEKIDQKF